jgi:hypothetical protein
VSTCADWKTCPISGFRFHAAPVKVKAFGTFPVRAYAVLDVNNNMNFFGKKVLLPWRAS